MKVSKKRLNELINVSNNRCGIDIHYTTKDGSKKLMVGVMKK
ncbi:hypothetical protein [Clostridium sp.]|nr:hypothetical protein [Clostridium sp.]